MVEPEFSLDWEDVSGRFDKNQRWRLYRVRSHEKDPQLVATCGTEEAVGTTLIRLAQEGEFDDCAVGLLDNLGETGKKWVILPYLASPRNLSDAGKVLRKARK